MHHIDWTVQELGQMENLVLDLEKQKKPKEEIQQQLNTLKTSLRSDAKPDWSNDQMQQMEGLVINLEKQNLSKEKIQGELDLLKNSFKENKIEDPNINLYKNYKKSIELTPEEELKFLEPIDFTIQGTSAELTPYNPETNNDLIKSVMEEDFRDPETGKIFKQNELIYRVDKDKDGNIVNVPFAPYIERLKEAKEMIINPSKFNLPWEPIAEPDQLQIEAVASANIQTQAKEDLIKYKADSFLSQLSSDQREILIPLKVRETLKEEKEYIKKSEEFSLINNEYKDSPDLFNLTSIVSKFQDPDYNFNLEGLGDYKKVESLEKQIKALGDPEELPTESSINIYNNLVKTYNEESANLKTIKLNNGKVVPKATFELYQELVQKNTTVQSTLQSLFKDITELSPQVTNNRTELKYLEKEYDWSVKQMDEAYSNIFQTFALAKEGGLQFLGDVAQGVNEQQASEFFNKKSDEVRENIEIERKRIEDKYADSIGKVKFDDALGAFTFEKGWESWGNLGTFLAEATIGQTGTLTALALGIGPGLSLIAGGSYGETRNMLDEEEKQGGDRTSLLEKMAVSAGYATLEGGLGYLPTARIFNRSINAATKQGKRNLVNEGIGNYIGRTMKVGVIKDGPLEGLTEGATIFGQNYIDYLRGAKQGYQLFDGVGEAAFTGYALGFQLSTVPQLGGAILRPFSDFNTNKKIQDLTKQENELKNIAFGNSVTGEIGMDQRTSSFKIAKKRLGELNQEINNEIQNLYKKVDANLEPTGFGLFYTATQKQEELRRQAEDIINSYKQGKINKKYKDKLLLDAKILFDAYEVARNDYKKDYVASVLLLPEDQKSEYFDKAKTELENENKNTKPEDIKKRAQKIWQVETFDKNVKKDLDLVKRLGKKGLNISYFASDNNGDVIKEFEKAIMKRVADPNSSLFEQETKAKSIINKFAEGVESGSLNGINYVSQNTKTGKRVYDIIISKKNAINNGKSFTSTHEIGHLLFTEALGADPKAFKPFADQILEHLKLNNPSAYNRIYAATKNNYDAGLFDEVLTEFLEELPKINLEAKENKGILAIFGKLPNFLKQTTGTQPGFALKGEIDIVEFLTTLSKKLNDGELTVGDVKEIQDADFGQDQTINTQEDSAKESRTVENLVKEYQETKVIPGDLKEQYIKLGVFSLKKWGAERGVPITEIIKNPTKLEQIVSDIDNQFVSIMKNYNPVNKVTGQPVKFSTYVGNILGRRVGPKLVEEFDKQMKTGDITPAFENKLFSEESADQKFAFEQREKEEAKTQQRLIDIRQRPNVKNVLSQLENIVKSKPGESSADIIKNNRVPVASKIYDISEKKLLNNESLTYSLQGGSSETSRIQGDFRNAQQTEKSLKLLPPFNIIGTEVMINAQGEIIRAPKDIRGRSIGNSRKINEFFYEPYIDPRSTSKDPAERKLAETNKSGRSKGATSQTDVFKLKPEFVPNSKGQLNPVALEKARDWAGLNIDFDKLKGKELVQAQRNLATKLKGWAVLQGGQVALSIADKALPSTVSPETKARTRGGRSRAMFSETLAPGKSTVEAITKFARNKVAAIKFGPIFANTFFSTSVNADAGNRGVVYNLITGFEELGKGAFNTGRSFIGSLKKLRFEYGPNGSKENRPDIIAGTEALIEDKKLGILEDIKKIAQKTLSEVTTDLNLDDINAMRMALSPQNYPKYKKSNKENLKTLKKGKKLILEKFKELYDSDNSLLPVIKYLAYAVNSNYHPFRNLAILEGGVEKGYEEHMLQYKPFVDTFIAAIQSTKTDFDGFVKWANDNYFQESITKKTKNGSAYGMAQSILDQPLRNKNRFTNETITPWRSQFEMHPIMQQQVDEALQGKRKWEDVISVDIRKYNEYNTVYGLINPNVQSRFEITDAARYNVVVPLQFKFNPNVVAIQNKAIYEYLLGNIDKATAKKRVDTYVADLSKSITKAEIQNNNALANGVKFKESRSNKEVLKQMDILDKAFDNARDANAKTKGISVWDFDDTLATTKSNVLYILPNGKTGSINASEFALQSDKLVEEGAEFDFSEFNKITEGKKGPMFQKALNRNKKFGNENVFILTARPMAAAKPIRDFLKALGLEIPLKNIVGLENGDPQAKARWVVEKASEGYNDFYFADDAYKNVKAVNDALSVLDVKSKARQAFVKYSKSEDLSKGFNRIIEDQSGIGADKIYSKAKAVVAGAGKGRFNFFVPYAAEDFIGLLYTTLGKGSKGEAQMAWFKRHLLDPFARGSRNISIARVNAMNNYRALKSELKIVPKDLLKKIPGEPYTKEMAVRVYIWDRQNESIPGLSKTDQRELKEYVESNSQLKTFADELIDLQKGQPYASPRTSWLAGGITGDILRGLDTTTRAKYLEQWQTNADAIFTQANLNKLQAAYGQDYVEALVNMLERMKSGSNRNFKGDSTTGKITDWLTGSIGTIMFFNMRSALLQTISSVNYINWSDNNIFKAGLAFANQKQYWKDFITLFNSPDLIDRRRGLRLNVNESDIAKIAQQNGVQGVINKLLELGFLPTQIADSFAIASGGATMYRNRIKKYTQEGFSLEDASQKALLDWREITEENQQSSRPDKISMQQAGPLGRIVLAFANTPMQYTRLMKKAALDLKNGRGDAKTNISKIIYYAMVQNFIFNALQQALFAIGFGEEEEPERDKKYYSIANSMLDTILRGTGVGGSITSVVKNSIVKMIDESKKKNPKYEKLAATLLQISPPVSSKYNRITNAARSYKWDKEEMFNEGWSLDNPAFLAGGNVISATTNIPLDRLVKKATNVKDALGEDLETWERLALIGGWQDWELGIDNEKPKQKSKSRNMKSRSMGSKGMTSKPMGK